MYTTNNCGPILTVLFSITEIILSVRAITKRNSQTYPTSSLSAKTIALCRDVLEKAGVKDSDTIIIRETGCPGAAAADTINNTLFLNTNQFDSFTYEEKVALLAHEAIHFRENHYVKVILATFSTFPFLFAAQYALNSSHFYTEPLLETAKHCPSTTKMFTKIISTLSLYFCTPYALLSLGITVAFMIPPLACRWYLELRATREGVRALNCCDGFLSYIAKRKEQITTQDAHMNILQKLFNRVYFHFFHPPLDWHEQAARQGAQHINSTSLN